MHKTHSDIFIFFSFESFMFETESSALVEKEATILAGKTKKPRQYTAKTNKNKTNKRSVTHQAKKPTNSFVTVKDVSSSSRGQISTGDPYDFDDFVRSPDWKNKR